MLNEEQRMNFYEDYVATGLKILAESYVRVHGGDLQLPSFVEMTHPEQKGKEDAQKVIDHVKELFA